MPRMSPSQAGSLHTLRLPKRPNLLECKRQLAGEGPRKLTLALQTMSGQLFVSEPLYAGARVGHTGGLHRAYKGFAPPHA